MSAKNLGQTVTEMQSKLDTVAHRLDYIWKWKINRRGSDKDLVSSTQPAESEYETIQKLKSVHSVLTLKADKLNQSNSRCRFLPSMRTGPSTPIENLPRYLPIYASKGSIQSESKPNTRVHIREILGSVSKSCVSKEPSKN